MRANRELKRAFGNADPAFVKAVDSALISIQKNGEEPIMKKKIRVSLAAAIIACLLLAAIAFAASRLGILDFIIGRFAVNVRLLPSANEIIRSNIDCAPASTQYAVFTVREAIFDGKYAYVVVAATPADEQTLLLGLDSDPAYPVSDFGPDYQDIEGSIAEYASSIGARPMAYTWLAACEGSEVFIENMDYMREADGTMVYMFMGAYGGSGEEAALALSCASWIAGDPGSEEKQTLAFTLPSSGALDAATSARSAVFEDCGVRVDEVSLTATPMAVYAAVRFTVIDPEKYAVTDDGLWFEFLDENGTRIAGGATTGGSITALNDGETEFLQEVSLSAMQALPETITLRGYNCWEKNRYEAHEITLVRSR